MSYTALYRKFRPQTFSDVKGQDHIVKTLKNQLSKERLSHAYIFCGTRGTGKTTIAKILARTVNCENPTEDGPCCQCESCRSASEGNNLNIIEIDAASNNGVENIREIIEEVSYSPVNAKYKVYIIDEVHMLSKGAFNALLKTLEEPPKYALFILATTDAHSVPITIMSRCQRYDFRRISIDTISDRLKELTDIEGLKADEKALRFVAKTADGSMRDALSLLDQCVAFNFGESLSYEKVLEVLGAVDTDVFSRMLGFIRNEDVLGAIKLIEEIVYNGREINQFVTDFIWYLRNLMLVKSCDSKELEDVLDASEERLAEMKREADELPLQSLFRYINVFSDALNKMKYSSQKRVLLEMTLIRSIHPQMQRDEDSVLERIRCVEDKLEKGEFTVAVGNVRNSVAAEPQKKQPVIRPKSIPEDIEKIVRDWPVILGNMMGEIPVILKKAMHSVGDNGELIIGVTNDFYKKQLDDPERKAEIEETLSEYTGTEVHFRTEVAEDRQDFNDKFADISSYINFDIKHE